MKLSLAAVTLALSLATLQTHGALASARPAASPTLKVLAKSGPHQIAIKKELVTFYFVIKGMTIHATYPSANVAGQGHVQMYLDKIPSDAYKVKDLTNVANYNAPGKVGKNKYAVTVEFDNAWVRAHKGQHTLLIGLARNDMIMYKTTPVPFSLDVK